VHQIDAIRQTTLREGFQTENAPELANTISELNSVREAAFKYYCEPLDEAQIAVVLDSVAQDESLTIDTAFAQAAGVDEVEWCRRVEQYQQRRFGLQA
jgi:hypothetical protein